MRGCPSAKLWSRWALWPIIIEFQITKLNTLLQKSTATTATLSDLGRPTIATPSGLTGIQGNNSQPHAILLSVFQVNGSTFGVKIQRQGSLFTHAETRLLGSAERQLIFHPCRRQIDRDKSGLDPVDELMHASKISRNNRSR